MAQQYGISEKEYQLIKNQTARRAQLRGEFLKQKTNPWKHSSEAGYVFDPAIQRYLSKKVCQYDYFKPHKGTSFFGMFAIVIPMVVYGYFINKDRTTREAKIRSGELRYRDRWFKLQ